MDDADPEQFLDGKEIARSPPRASKPPDPNGELMPVMRLLDDCLLTNEIEPPMRSPSGWPVEVRAHEPLGMHELVSAGANDDGGEANEGRRRRCSRSRRTHSAAWRSRSKGMLPSPADSKERRRSDRGPQATADGVRQPLPEFHCISPAARRGGDGRRYELPNGRLLAANGLDRDRRIVFRIEPEIVGWIPTDRASGAAVAHAIKFLTDEWLIDVQTDYAGKCVLLCARAHHHRAPAVRRAARLLRHLRCAAAARRR